MEDIFNHIWSINGVIGITFLSLDGQPIYHQYRRADGIDPQLEFLVTSISAIGNRTEVDLVFEKLRLYIRRAAIGYLIIAIQSEDAIAMVRLNCDVILPELTETTNKQGIKNLEKAFASDNSWGL